MAEIKLNKRYKYAGDIFQKLIGIGFDVETATAFLNEVEDANVVEVVRCEKCKYRKIHTCAITGIETLFCDYGNIPVAVEPTHYCSYGERRKGDDV